MFLAFDFLHQDGVDLRSLPLTERKYDLNRLCRQSRTPFLKQVETFPTAWLCSTIATSSGLRVSFPSDVRRVIPAARAATGRK